MKVVALKSFQVQERAAIGVLALYGRTFSDRRAFAFKELINYRASLFRNIFRCVPRPRGCPIVLYVVAFSLDFSSRSHVLGEVS